MPNNQLMRIQCAALGIVTLLFAAGSSIVAAQTSSTASSSTNARPATGKISGVVFDSVLMQPMANIHVRLAGSAKTAVTDNRGRFELTEVPAGAQMVSYTAPVLDSLGFGPLGRAVSVTAGATAQVSIGTPSPTAMWRALCTNKTRIGPDSGIVWGNISSTRTNQLLSGAPVLFSWYDLNVRDKSVNMGEKSTGLQSDSTGTYYACGLPMDVAIASQALDDSAASGEVQYQIGARYLRRIDLAVSPDLASVLQKNSGQPGTSVPVRPHGQAVLRGTVRDSNGVGIAGALVTVATMDTSVNTNTDGSFFIPSMPSGTLGVSVRSVGYSANATLVDLRPEVTTDVNFKLAKSTALATVDVRGARSLAIDEEAFLARRKTSTGGIVIDMTNGRYVDPTSPLRTVPRVTIINDSGDVKIRMARPGGNTTTARRAPTFNPGAPAPRDTSASCAAKVYLDGTLIKPGELASRWTEIKVLEVYNNWLNVPPQYIGAMSNNPCGVILYWTRFTIKKEDAPKKDE